MNTLISDEHLEAWGLVFTLSGLAEAGETFGAFLDSCERSGLTWREGVELVKQGRASKSLRADVMSLVELSNAWANQCHQLEDQLRMVEHVTRLEEDDACIRACEAAGYHEAADLLRCRRAVLEVGTTGAHWSGHADAVKSSARQTSQA